MFSEWDSMFKHSVVAYFKLLLSSLAKADNNEDRPAMFAGIVAYTQTGCFPNAMNCSCVCIYIHT